MIRCLRFARAILIKSKRKQHWHRQPLFFHGKLLRDCLFVVYLFIRYYLLARFADI